MSDSSSHLGDRVLAEVSKQVLSGRHATFFLVCSFFSRILYMMLHLTALIDRYFPTIHRIIIGKQVKQQYPNAIECSIVDHSDGCGAKLELIVVSDSFEGMMLLKRHREIQNHLKEKGLFDEIHALQIKAWTPSQWEKKKGEN
jgi:acid stress-induced BolA-like protein IbaG/YrbA